MKNMKTLAAYFLISAVYVLSGKAALLLALPPGYASAVFPPAGIAVAVAYIVGRRALPWVFIGSLILNVWVGYSATKLIDATGIYAALIIASASTVQAAFGGWILRRRIGYPAAFDKAVEITRLLLWGPLICLSSASLSVAGLMQLGLIEKSSSAASWITWWIGDTLGFLIMLPIVMALIGEPRALWRGRIKTVALPMLLVISIFVAVFLKANEWEQNEALTDFRHTTQQSLDQIKMGFGEQGALLAQLRGFFEHDTDGKVTRKEFHRYCKASLQVFPMIQAMEWVPRVSPMDRESFEAEQQKEIPGFHVTERSGAGKMLRAGMRDWYYPVTYLEPVAGNEQALGFDLASNPKRKHAIEKAIRSGKAVATEPINLVQGGKGLLIIQSVKKKGEVEGVILIVLKVHEFITTLLPPSSRNLEVSLVDDDAQDVLYRNFQAEASEAVAMRAFEFGLRHYSLKTTPAAEYYKQHRRWQSWGVLAIGTFGTGLLGALFLLGTGYAARVEDQVKERTKALQESEERFRHTFEYSPIGIGVASLEGKLLRGNQAFCTIFGCTKEELRDMSIEEITLPGRRTRDADNKQRLVSGGTSHYRMEKRHFRRDGKTIWIQVTASLERDIDGIPEEFIIQIEDITERKLAEEKLQAALQRNRTLFESSRDALMTLAPPTWKFTSANQATLRLFGAGSEGEMTAIGPWSVSPEYQPDGRASAEKAQEMIATAMKEGSHLFEWEHCRLDGACFPADVLLTRMEFGKEVFLQATVRDISERKEAEAALSESEGKLRGLFELSPLGIALTDMNGQYIEFNRAFQEICGYPLEELNRLDYWKLTPKKYAKEEEKQLESLRTTGQYGPYEKEYIRKDGTLIPVRLNGLLIAGRDGKQYIWSIVEDITVRKRTEDSLKSYAAEIEDLYDHAPCGYHSVDEDGMIVRVNQTELDWFGRKREEVIGRRIADFFTPASRAIMRDSFERFKQEGSVQDLEFEIVRKDGTIFPVLLNGTAIYDENGKFVMSRSVLIDITTQKKMDQMIQDKMLELQSILDGASVAITFVRGRRQVWANKRMGELFGYSAEEMDNQPTRMFYGSEKDYDAFGVRAYPALMRGETFQAEMEMRHHDGHAIWINISGKAISPADMSLGSIWVLEDITERKQYEEAARESAEHMQTIFDNVVDGIITIDEEGIIATFNKAAEHIFGYSEEEAVGRNVSLLMPPPDREKHGGYIRNYMITKIPNLLGTRRELTGLRSDGTEFPMDVALSEISRKGQRMFVGIVRDISERRRMEKMKNEFVSTVSHELRTPLTSITGALGLMAGGALGSLPEQLGPLVDIAYKNSQQLGYLINDLLDMEKIAVGKLHFDMQVQELMPLVEQAIEVNHGYGDQYHVRYVLKQRMDGARVRVDSKRFVQILSNFLSNAAKFSPAGSEVEISVKQNGGLVRVEVLDHGGGIPDEFRNRIFQKFSQADSSDTRKKGGTGLGLAISKELAERMEGGVGFESEAGKGTIFFIDLPLHRDVQLDDEV